MKSGQGVTTQHDAKMIYRKKRMPAKRRSRWKRFTKKVHAVAEKRLGAQTVVFNKTQEFLNTVDGQQIVGSIALYPMKSTSSWLNDLKEIYDTQQVSRTVNNTKDIADAGVTGYLNKTSNLMFQSGVLDITFRNTSGDSVTGDLNSVLTLEVDVYELTVGREMDETVTAGHTEYADIGALFNAGFADTLATGAQANSIGIADRGVTPWEATQALSQWRIKILKKTKYFVPNNGYFTYQMRDPGRHVINMNKIEEHSGPNKPGLTKWIFFLAKTLPGVVNTAAVAQSLTVGITRKYMYKITGEASRREFIHVNT